MFINLYCLNIYLFYRYKRNLQELYQLFKDRPMSPRALVAYWTEYVIKHNGTEHMNSASNDMFWYQYHQLDVILIVILISISLLSILLYISVTITYSIVKFIHLKQIKTE